VKVYLVSLSKPNLRWTSPMESSLKPMVLEKEFFLKKIGLFWNVVCLGDS
jgi:hypothetical protein